MKTANSACNHLVHFYDGAYPADEACDFIVAGLLAGDTCVVMLIRQNRQAVEARLNTRRIFTTPASPHSGSYRTMDTDEALAELLVDSRLDMNRAAAKLGPLLSPATQGGSGRVRLVGDPAAVLFAAGNREDAFALEALVDGLAIARGASIFCAYRIQDFCRERNTNSLFRISAEHSALHFPERLWVQGYLDSTPTNRDAADDLESK
jgi:MEDS: MEthanogen/methylotroph, DcmR Sensory domain